jgi:hypothetical protein
MTYNVLADLYATVRIPVYDPVLRLCCQGLAFLFFPRGKPGKRAYKRCCSSSRCFLIFPFCFLAGT